ncbi:MAG: STAS domain-containing protein [Nitrospira sp.]|nr:STAS domain-containing protein [Nitrospira sp.]
MRNSVLLRRRLFQLLAGNGRCVSIDCESVEFMDGAALATIVEFVMECRRRGVNLRLLNPSKGVHDAFSLYSLERMLDEITELSDEEFEGVLIILEDEVYESIRIPGVPKPAAQPEPAPLRRVV